MTAPTKNGGSSHIAVPVGPRLKGLIKIAYRARRPVLLEGPTGVGKSEILQQVAAELGIDLIVLDLSLLEPPDLVGLPYRDNGHTAYAAPKILPQSGAGILLLEELNRAERYIQQPALQLLTARRLHEYQLPERWVPSAAINPDGEEYQVTPMDPALRARFLSVTVRADRQSWLLWAEMSQVHPTVLKLARLHDRFVDDVPPRSWKYVSDVLYVLGREELRDAVLMRDLVGGYLPTSWAEVLLEAVVNGASEAEIDVPQLLRSYGGASGPPRPIRNLTKQGRTDTLDAIVSQLTSFLEGPEMTQMVARKEFDITAFQRLLADLPGDQRERTEEAFGKNPASAALIDVQAQDVLKGYAGSAVARRVDGWVQDPMQRYRVLSLVTALCHHLERVPGGDLIGLRKKTDLKIGLGIFLGQIGKASDPLLKILDRLSIVPIVSRQERRGRR